MSLSFIRRAFGIKKSEEKEFDNLIKFFEGFESFSGCQTLTKNFKRKHVRFLVIGHEGSKVFFDSFPQKDGSKSLPIFTFGATQANLADFVFGSDFLSSSKDLLYSIKVHDLGASGYLLITRVVSDLDNWLASRASPRPSLNKRSSPSVQQLSSRSETSVKNTVAACLLINVDGWSSQPFSAASNKTAIPSTRTTHRSFSHAGFDNHRSLTDTLDTNQRSHISFNRFYRMLFEHCVPLSILIESLASDAFLAICRARRSHLGSRRALSESQCSEAISFAFSKFMNSFKDFFAPRLCFPVWATLNNIVASTTEKTVQHVDQLPDDTEGHWSNSFLDVPLRNSTNSSTRAMYDVLADIFLRCCLSPLVCRDGKEHRHFLGQVVTGLLMLHPGWVTSLMASSSPSLLTYAEAAKLPSPTSHWAFLPNVLLHQLLTQCGCMSTNLNLLGGSIFNCTILVGQSRKYLLALLYFATYFLRFVCVLFSTECVPDLGRADLFELEQQRRQSRGSIKTQRKSTSASSTIGDPQDSGISSQEDLTTSMYSASTGSSPTHASGMALCMTNRLTRDQCRIAEFAAQLMVSREAAAAASVMHQNTTNVTSTTRSTTEMFSQSDATASLGVINSANPSHSRLTEIPLLIEKCTDEQDALCGCLSVEFLPPQLTATSPRSSLSASTLHRSTPTHCESPDLFEASRPLQMTGHKCNATSPNGSHSNNHLFGASDSSPSSSPFDRIESTSITNHLLIGNSVSEHFTCGLALQATCEPFESFRTRLIDHLVQWLKLGPIITRGLNLAAKKTIVTLRDGRQTNQHPVTSHWCSSSLIVNTDNKTVEMLTCRLPPAMESSSVIDSSPSCSSPHFGSRHSFAQPTFGSKSNSPSHGSQTSSAAQSYATLTPLPCTVKPAELVLHLLDQTRVVFERTACASLALRDMENTLYLIYYKSRVLADLLMKTGPSFLHDFDRMAAAASCSTSDIPLLLSTAAAYSSSAASVLFEHHSDWWIA
ncbi:unnamed protein product [Dicrocoelium dendriticum]|nr:unnamed protein product [Dicrocoelium dendriticum]